jgi:hypothetical protein
VTDGRDTLSGLYELLDRAVAAINHGDRATASKLAGPTRHERVQNEVWRGYRAI